MSFIDYLFEKDFISEDVAKYLIPNHLYRMSKPLKNIVKIFTH